MDEVPPHVGLRFSIITPCLNRAGYVAQAIESVWTQQYGDFEHIIIDGGSTDGTLEILAQYPHLRVVSEPDSGMYEALNKGLALASGDIIGFLNTDDFYAPDAFHAAADGLANSASSFVAGEAQVVDEAGGEMVLAQDARLLDDLLHGAILGTPRMNAFFFRRDVFQTVGGFDASLRMAADRDFMMRLALSGLTGIEIEQVLYCYREHVGSMTFALDYRKIEAIVDEHARWSQKYLQQPGLPAEAGGYLSELRVRDSLWICQESLRQRDLAGALRHAREGVRYSPFWALRFVRDAMLFLARRAAALVHCSQ